jgi:tripartite ATP-independent transporter DctP family solute receptor
MRKLGKNFIAAVIFWAVSANPLYAATYKIANVLTPTHPYNVSLQKFAEDIKAESSGRIQFEILHSGVLGGDVEQLTQVIAGSLDSVVMGGVSVFQNFNKKSGVEELPFLFKDLETARQAYDGEFGQKINEEIIVPLGLVPLGYMENGLRHFTNSKRPIVKPADMKGIKFRSGVSPIRIEMFRLLDAQAVSMAFPELFTGLQQGTVDGQENPLAIIYSSKFYEVQKYLSMSGHIYNSGPIIFNKKIWEAMPGEDQELIRNIAVRLSI